MARRTNEVDMDKRGRGESLEIIGKGERKTKGDEKESRKGKRERESKDRKEREIARGEKINVLDMSLRYP